MLNHLKSSVTTKDKILIRWWKNAWKLKAPTQGTLFLIHGIGEHSGRYHEFAKYLTNWGFDVLSFDLPGHGLTARKGNYLRYADLTEMREEAKDVLRYWMMEGPEASPELRAKPLYLMGHSLGALIALFWTTSEAPQKDYPFIPKKILATSPPLALSMKVPRWKEGIAQFLHTSMPDIKMGNEISPSDLSADQVKLDEYLRDPWRSSKASPRLYLSMKAAMKSVRRDHHNIEQPFMLISGSEDPIIDHVELKQFYEHLNTHKRWTEFKGMHHEVLNEMGREKVYEEVLKWFLT